MKRFLPNSVLEAFHTKKLRKQIIANFKEFSPLSEDECVLRFYQELRHVSSFHQESFKCALGEWNCVPCMREVFSSSDMATNMNGKVEHLPEQTMHVAYKEEFVGGGSFFLL